MSSKKTHWPTEETISLAVPASFAAKFVAEEGAMTHNQRSYAHLMFGDCDLGTWRIDGVMSDASEGYPRMIATLRKVWPDAKP